MYKARNNTIPLGYQSTLKNHPVKYLQNPIPGTYSKNADDPETQDLIIEQYKMTDEDGKVTFDDLKLSQSGPIGNFTLSFTCGNNVVNAIHDVEVRTSIEKDKIKFTQQLPKEVLVGDLSQQAYDFVAIIEVVDEQEKGVTGKYPERVYITTNQTAEQGNIEISIADEDGLFEASGADGVMTIPLKVTKLLQQILANITLEIDGINVTTSYINFRSMNEWNDTVISKIEFTEVPTTNFENGLIINQNFELKAKASNLNGDAVELDDYTVCLDLFFQPFMEAPRRKGFVEIDVGSTSTKKGEVTFKNVHFTRAGTGHYYFRVLASTLTKE